MAGVSFIQRDFDDSNTKSVGSYKPGNTDVIRTMLREQQKECQTLHANSLFREFRGDGQKQRKFGKGYLVQGEANAPQFDDLVVRGWRAEGNPQAGRIVIHARPGHAGIIGQNMHLCVSMLVRRFIGWQHDGIKQPAGC